MKTTLVLLCAISLVGCASPKLTPAGQRVKISSKDEVAGMQFVGNVEGSSGKTGVMRHEGYRDATTEMLNEAGKLGATNVVLEPGSEAHYWTTSEIARGEAYKAAVASVSGSANAR